MARIRKSSRAETDLLDITDYIAIDNLDAALRWLDGIQRLFQMLARSPLMGEDVGHLLTGCRRHVYGNYLVFYLAEVDGITIVRVLHGSRQIEDLSI